MWLIFRKSSAAIFDFYKNMNHIFVNVYQNLKLILNQSLEYFWTQ